MTFLSNEQMVINALDYDLWSWLIETVDQIMIGERTEAEKIFSESPFTSSIKITLQEDDRILVDMNSFGFGVSFSWQIVKNGKDFDLSDFRMEGGDFDETGICSSAHV